MRFSYTTHKGISPKVEPHLLSVNRGVTAKNCKIYSGSIRPYYASLLTDDLSSDSSVTKIYYYLGQYWFEFGSDVDVQESPVAENTENRIYWTGDGIPKKTNETEATTGSGKYPISFYPLSVPTPDYAPTVALGAAGTGDDRDISYVWTVVTSWGEEGLPSEASTVVVANQGQTVNLSGMTLVWNDAQSYSLNSWVFPTVSTGFVYRCVTAGISGALEPDWNNTQDGDTPDNTVTWRAYKEDILTASGAEKRIYRANSGETSVSWRLLDTIAITATTYEDTTTDDDLEATVLPSAYWNPPPDGAKGLVALSNGSFACFVGKDVYLSEPNYPHAWPYGLSVSHDIVALAAIGNAIVVMTERNPVIFNGTHPSAMTPKKLPQARRCVSKGGVVNFPGGVLYPSPNGLEAINGTDLETITRDFVGKEEWADFYPETFKSVFHDEKYFGFYSYSGEEGAIVFDTKTGDITTLDFCPDAVYVDEDTDTLYYIVSNSEIILRENGTSYPSRTNGILREDGSYFLRE